MTYDDIINLEHPTSSTHPRMPLAARAAQFSPFAALTGYDDAIAETSRLTDSRRELSEEETRQLNETVQELSSRINEHPQVAITYFLQDQRKSGGEYVTASGRLKSIDEAARRIMLSDGTSVSIDDISDISCTD